MRRREPRSAFSKGVGKRIVGLFLLAAIVPMLFTITMAYHEFNEGMRREAAKSLRDRAKEYGFELLTRLRYTNEKALQIVREVEAGRDLESGFGDFLLGGFDAVWTLPNETVLATDAYKLPTIPPSAFNAELLSSGNPQLLLGEQNELILLHSVKPGGGPQYLAFKVSAAEIWGDREGLTYTAEYCVFTPAGAPLHCTAPMGASLQTELQAASADPATNTFVEWSDEGETYFAARWQLFLEQSFGLDGFAIVAMQQKTFALRSGAQFRRIFAPSAILVLLLVGVLSLSYVSRSLTPLRKLTEIARRFADGHLSSRVQIATGDEFEKLADAFNNMAGRLGRQISALEALSDIDRLILTGAKLDQVSERVLRYLIDVVDYGAAGVIIRAPDAPGMGSMISAKAGEGSQTQRIRFPTRVRNSSDVSRDTRQAVVVARDAPVADRFSQLGYPVAVYLPVLLGNKVKGLLVLGLPTETQLPEEETRQCQDLAGRFSVALASAEREETLHRQAHFDELTGLPNRQLMKDRLEQCIASQRNDTGFGALLFLDLDRFKEVNDVSGHTVGDAVLCQTSERITAAVRDGDTVARLGGDEFVVILPNVTGERIVRSTATRLLQQLSEGFSVRGADHYLSASIGIATFPADGTTVETLLQNADAAMYRAKDAGRNRFEFYSKSQNAESRRRIRLERDLRKAVTAAELEVHYQPQLKLANSEISGAEALVRWTHPVHGRVGPDEFIPLAEDTDLIIDLGSLVIEKACKDLRDILNHGWHPGVLSINVSARQLADSNFETAVMEPIQRYGIHPGYIQLEITETTVAQNRMIAIEVLESLQEKGIRIALDDFGTGYSSLSYLQQMPFDSLKIDKSFVDRIGSGETPDNLCKTIIKMAEQLGKRSIAEGVETIEQLNFLRRNDCDIVQGYYYSRPLPFNEFREFVGEQSLHTQRRRILEMS